jgi:hypothetical protein
MFLIIVKILLSIVTLSLFSGIAVIFIRELSKNIDSIRQYKELNERLLQPMEKELRRERFDIVLLTIWFVLIENLVVFFEVVAVINMK